MSGKNFRRILPSTHRNADTIPSDHYRYHGLYGCLHYWLLLHNCAAMHQPSSSMGPDCESNMLDCIHDQDFVIRQRVPQHRDRRLVLDCDPHPIAVESPNE